MSSASLKNVFKAFLIQKKVSNHEIPEMEENKNARTKNKGKKSSQWQRRKRGVFEEENWVVRER